MNAGKLNSMVTLCGFLLKIGSVWLILLAFTPGKSQLTTEAVNTLSHGIKYFENQGINRVHSPSAQGIKELSTQHEAIKTIQENRRKRSLETNLLASAALVNDNFLFRAKRSPCRGGNGGTGGDGTGGGGVENDGVDADYDEVDLDARRKAYRKRKAAQQQRAKASRKNQQQKKRRLVSDHDNTVNAEENKRRRKRGAEYKGGLSSQEKADWQKYLENQKQQENERPKREADETDLNAGAKKEVMEKNNESAANIQKAWKTITKKMKEAAQKMKEEVNKKD